MKIAFLGTPAFAVPSLQALIDAGHTLCVFSQPDRPAGFPLFDRGLDFGEEVVRLLVDRQVGVAGQPEEGAADDFMQLKEGGHMADDDVFQQDEGALFAPVLQFDLRQLEEAGED